MDPKEATIRTLDNSLSLSKLTTGTFGKYQYFKDGIVIPKKDKTLEKDSND